MRDQREPFNLCLGNEHAIKGVFMVRWQLLNG
jgi:hypothetical protein